VNESETKNEVAEQIEQDYTSTSKGPSIRVQKNHPQDLIIGNPDRGIITRRSNGIISNSLFLSKIEPKNIHW